MSTKRDDTSLYKRFIGELNTSTPELQELFTQEVLNLTRDEQMILRDNDFGDPDAWSEEARANYTVMLARAAVKAKKIGTHH